MSDSRSPETELFLQRLIHSARAETSSTGLEAQVLSKAERAHSAQIRRRRFALSLSAVGIAASCGLFFWLSSSPRVPSVAPEIVLANSAAGEQELPAEAPPLTPANPQPKICEKHAVADGSDPLIDDFEHTGPSPVVREARRGKWEFITDKESDQVGPFYSSTSALPEQERTVANQRAMHLKIEHLRDWGASLEYTFQPERCYDASVYSGIRFRAKGAVRLQVAARQPEVIPVQHGGACTKDCYISHLKVIDLRDEWTEYEVPFEQLQKRGYDSKALNPTRIHSLQFSVQSEDTPADIWIDDVSFMK